MKKTKIQLGKLSLEKLHVAKLDNLQTIQGGSFEALGGVINLLDDDDDGDGGGDTWPTHGTNPTITQNG